MRRDTGSKLALVVGATVLTACIVEGGVRLVARPSPRAWGIVLGRELPPVRVIPARLPDVVPGAAAPGEGPALDWTDLQGVLRPDPVIGYLPRERATSSNGWWRSNDLGARATADTSPTPAAGTTRVLVFGESFASGSRVRQEDAWPARLGAARPDLEVVNLAVDGYGMGQSLLRFQAVGARIDYALVFLLFVPNVDLWRDVNTIRSLAKPDWNSYVVMPRFVVAPDGAATLVPSPYAHPNAIYAANATGLSPELRRHLLAYDRFYFRARYESPPLIGGLVLFKMAAAVYAARATAAVVRDLGPGRMALDSEAMRVSRAIFAAMRAEAEARGKRFVLGVLPDESELNAIESDPAAAANWRDVVARLRADGLECLDLAGALTAVPSASRDRGWDGSHYGPTMNAAIAGAVSTHLAPAAR